MDILFEDKDIIVLKKPAGMAVQTKNLSEKSLETELKKYRKSKGESPEIFVVHRLDQPVSGLMVFAKDKKSAASLSEDLKTDSFTKVYRAKAYKGSGLPKAGTLIDYMIKDEKTNSSKVVKPETDGAKKAVLQFEVLDEAEDTVDLKIKLMTGRHHQIRVQFANAGLPLLGDLKYGSDSSIGFSKNLGIRYVELTASHLEFRHPSSKELMTFDI